MPLTGSQSVLSASIKANLLEIPQSPWQDGAQLTAMCDAIALAVVTHIVANAVVTGTAGAVPVVGTVT